MFELQAACFELISGEPIKHKCVIRIRRVGDRYGSRSGSLFSLYCHTSTARKIDFGGIENFYFTAFSVIGKYNSEVLHHIAVAVAVLAWHVRRRQESTLDPFKIELLKVRKFSLFVVAREKRA